jgi:uncharacterized protein (DUF1778 family)
MKIGRPKLEKTEQKAQIIGVRLKNEERALIEKAASKSNKGLSAWTRETLLTAAALQMQ